MAQLRSGLIFFAMPLFLLPNLAPMMINVEIPDQTKWPAGLRKILDAADSTHMWKTRASVTGIAKHVTYALIHWSSQILDFSVSVLQSLLGVFDNY
jgi:hypothetical protein